MTKVAVYLPKHSYLNEATSYYIDMVCDGLTNEKPNIVYRLSELKKCNCEMVLVIDAKSLIFVKLRYPTLKVITWYQGVVPEEALMVLGSHIRYIYWSVFELISLQLSVLNIFVSGAMKEHYIKKYKYNKNQDIIIPCFNKQLCHESIVENKSLSFVYAGSLHKWQCIDRMLSIFKCVQQIEPDATLDFYTFNVDGAQKIIDEFSLKNVKVMSASLDEIDKLISKSKYGFLIRDDHTVNNVATPTKLSTYLSVGTKPIVTDVIFDFRKNVDEDAYVRVSWLYSDRKIAELIVADYNRESAFDSFIIARDELFKCYLNRNRYVTKLREIMLK
ncbi:glycosyltransferase family protein [Aeromonas hydrophila]|uniref:hypothetical protein n=1 Tax=Aeromonas hydrophila TaxID=644 RepID=UPI0036DA4DE4